jgi:hypothetical protein
MSEIKWHWFFSPEPLLAVAAGIVGACEFTSGDCRWIWPMIGVGFGLVSVLWSLFVLRPLGPEKASPPVWFRVFWLAVIIVEFAVLMVF